MKKALPILLSLLLLAGCATISKLADQGMKSAEKAAANYVDKNTGSGTFDDMMAMKSDQQKTKKLLPYYMSANKLFDEKVITEQEKTDMKKSLDQYYSDFAEGKLDENSYDQKCKELIESASKEEKAEK